MKRICLLMLTAASALLGSGAAQAGNVYWSIGIQAPPIATVVSNGYAYPGPVYAPPVYVPIYAPAYGPVYAPVYNPPPRVVYRPVPVVYRPVPVYRGYRHEHRDWRPHDHRHDERWDYRRRGDRDDD